jgi:tripartite-type tricarboxylate transporter receptor subunit TctC
MRPFAPSRRPTAAGAARRARLRHSAALRRSAVLRGVAALWAAAILLAPLTALAQVQPGRPVRLLNPYPPGASSDVMARLFAERVAAELRAPVIVENRPGAGGAIGVEAVAKAAPDGHTLLFVNSGPMVLVPLLQKATPYDARRDLVAITQVATNVMVLVGHASGPQSLEELVTRARAEPGRVTYASIGNGSLLHIAGETLARLAKIDMVHVPYKGTVPAITDVLSRQVTIAFSDLVATRAHIEAGTLRALAVSGTRRWPVAPNVPLFGEQGYPALDRFMGWWG